ncbi:MAG: hypothetical protein ACRC8Y_03100 [Chroococcales cyanobacterium]
MTGLVRKRRSQEALKPGDSSKKSGCSPIFAQGKRVVFADSYPWVVDEFVQTPVEAQL